MINPLGLRYRLLAGLLVWTGLGLGSAPLRSAEADTPATAPPPAATAGGTPATAAPATATPATPAAVPPAVAEETAAAATNAAVELRAAQEAIERLRRELEQNAAQHADSITASLSLIEPALERMHKDQMDAVRSSNRTILVVVGTFAGLGFLGLVFILYILVRVIGRFSELLMASPSRPLLTAGSAVPVLGEGAMLSPRTGAAQQAVDRFQGAIDHLQRRIHELEQSFPTAPPEPHAEPAGASASAGQAGAAALANIQPLVPETSVTASRAAGLLGKGQALLNLDAAEQALQCFEEALNLEPENADVLVKRGMALEKMQDWEQALDSYNRAINNDPSMTVAYLYRGGVCNRLQRFREALESYEQALRTEKKSRAS